MAARRSARRSALHEQPRVDALLVEQVVAHRSREDIMPINAQIFVGTLYILEFSVCMHLRRRYCTPKLLLVYFYSVHFSALYKIF